MRSLVFVALLLGSSASADVTSEGRDYSISCNPEGYVLTSTGNFASQIGSGAGQKSEATEVLYLGKDCDALNKVYGSGTWSWANGGFLVNFPGKTFAFSRQELTCPEPQAFDDEVVCRE